MTELQAETKALRDLVRSLRTSKDLAWSYCRLAQRLYFQLHRSSWLSSDKREELANLVHIERPFSIEKMEGTYKGLEDWLPVPLVGDQVPPPVIPEGDTVSIMAEDCEFSVSESLVGRPMKVSVTDVATEETQRNDRHDS